MYLPDVTVHRPTSLTEASDLLLRLGPRARALAGGTDLLVDLKTGRADAEHLVSLARLPELRGVRLHPGAPEGNGEAGGSLWIGASTTIAELHRAPELTGGFEPIRDATRDMAATQVRNLATVGGNLCSAVPCADLPPILLVMEASVRLDSARSSRTIPLSALFTGPRRTALEPGELLAGVIVPRPGPRTGAAYARFALRDGNAIAVASVAAAARLSGDGLIAAAPLALGAVAPVPRLAAPAPPNLGLDEALADASRRAMAAAEPISDVRGSAPYRRELVVVLARRALAVAVDRAGRNTP